MAYVEFKDVYKRYQMGEVTISASDGVNFEILGSLIFGAILILAMWGLSVIL